MITLTRSVSVTGGLDLAAAACAFRLARSRASSRLAISLIDLRPQYDGGRQNPHSERRRGRSARADSYASPERCPPIVVPGSSPKLNGCPHNHCLALNRSHRSKTDQGCQGLTDTSLALHRALGTSSSLISPRPGAVPPPIGGRFMTTKPARSRGAPCARSVYPSAANAYFQSKGNSLRLLSPSA